MIESVVDALKRDIRAGFRMFEWTVRWKKCQFSNESLISIFRRNATKNADKVAIKCGHQNWTFKQLDEYSNRVANCLVALGLKAGDEVALLMNNRPEFIGIWIGLAKAGVITAFINTNNRLDILVNCLTAFKCSAVILDYQFYSAVADIYDVMQTKTPSMKYFVWTPEKTNNNIPGSPKFPFSTFTELLNNFSKNSLDVFHKRRFNDTLLYVFTSGTSGGKPKAAIESDARVIVAAYGHNIGYRFRDNDNFYISLPLYHAFAGVLAVAQCLIFGQTITIAERFSASKFWDDCIQHKCTVALYIGETCRYLLAQPPKPQDTEHSIRCMYGLGLRKVYWSEFKTRFAVKHVYEFYGASESNIYIVNINDREGSCGFIPYYYGIFLRIVYSSVIIRVDPVTLEPVRNRKGLCKLIRPGEIGVIVGRHSPDSPTKEFKGYTDSDQTKKKYIYNIMSIGDSGFISEDMLEMDRYGYLYFKDRTGDTFRWKGENVSTTDVEAVLQNVLNHKDCTVFGVGVGQCEGKAGMAAIKSKSDEIDLKALAEQLAKRLPLYAIPLFLRISDKIELTGTFKLIKYNLKKMGYDPCANDDMIYFFDKNANNYIRLTNELYESIESGRTKV